MNWLKRKFRLAFGLCPYCSQKLENGFGGSSLMFFNGMKMCPSRHYAEEFHYTGAILVYDNGGQPLESEDK